MDKMRKQDRLYNFYNELQTIHITFFNNLRFGQLMSNFFNWLINEKDIDLFFLEEEKIIEYIKEYTESFGNDVIL